MPEDHNYPESEVVVGIDVGGPRKGFHAVALRGMTFLAKTKSPDVALIARWCCDLKTTVVAVDAPCRWRPDGGPVRLAESEMAARRIACYYAPTELKAQSHLFYTWMLAGIALYKALLPGYPLYLGSPVDGCVVIETFPHAVSCALAGDLVSAKLKGTIRRQLLGNIGIAPTYFSNIDEVDAALCAVAARSFARNTFKTFGDRVGGFIVVPNLSSGFGSPTSENCY
jgi:predicted nuclease with RNAse H fold